MVRCSDLTEISGVIARHGRILVITHEKPDGDAIGSALGLVQILRGNGKKADALLPEDVPDKYKSLTGNDFLTQTAPAELNENYDLAVVLDCASDRRAGLGRNACIDDITLPLAVIDHHSDNSMNGQWVYVDGGAAACAELIYRMAAGVPEWSISPKAATLLLLGIITDTGSFRFSNSSASVLRTAADLRELGADWDGAVNAAFFSKTLRQQRFEAELLGKYVKSACNGRFLYAFIPAGLLEAHGFDMRDGEGIIDFLREIQGVAVAALAYPRDGRFKLSLRSKDRRYPVSEVAHLFGGGGHRMAAGGAIEASSLQEAEAKLLNAVTNLLGD